MKKYKQTFVFLSLLIAFTIVSYFQFYKVEQPSRAIAQIANLDGEYEVQGSSSVNGDFVGKAWVHDGDVQRKIEWKTFGHQNMAVESIWSGKVSNKHFEFELGLSNVITSYEGFNATKEDLVPVKLQLPLERLNSDFEYNLKNEGEIKETWTRVADAGEIPLWVNRRTSFVGVGDKHPLITALSKLAGIYKVIEAYRELPQIKIYNNREEFKKGQQIWIEDKTDYDFYSKNPNRLRITNKTVNPLSLAEALMKRNAYGKNLTNKERFLSNETTKYNLNAGGLLELAQLDDNGNKVGSESEGDSALWTAMFGWSQVLRYQLTKDPEAKANFLKILEGTVTLIDITQDNKQFARTVAVSPKSEVWGDEWVQGEGRHSHLKWKRGGNNDMAKGVFITLALAHKMVDQNDPKNAELVARIKKAVKTLPEVTTIAERNFNYAIAKGLDALWNKDQESLEIYEKKLINFTSFISEFTHLDAGLYIEGIADWSGIHLTMTSIMAQLYVSEELETVFPKDYFVKKIRKKAEDSLVELDGVYKNAHRRFVTIAAYAFSPKARKDKKFEERAKEAIWTLREVPAPRFVGNGYADLTLRSDWSISAWPRQPWKGLTGFRKLKDKFDVSDLQQGAYFYPYYEASSWNTTYYWKDIPFPVRFGSTKNIKSFSSDYLMLYWVSRSAGLITENE